MVDSKQYTILPFPAKADNISGVAVTARGGSPISISPTSTGNYMYFPLSDYVPNTFDGGNAYALSSIKLYVYYTGSMSGTLYLQGWDISRINSYSAPPGYNINTTSWTSEGTNTYSIELTPNIFLSEDYGYGFYLYNMPNSSAVDFQGGTITMLEATVSDAPTWASPKFPARTTTNITLDWVTPGYDGGSPILEYWYQWKIDAGSYLTIDTNSTNTIASKPFLSAGAKYWFRVLARNIVGNSPFTSAEFHWTRCDTPSAPTVTANAVGSLRIQHSDITGIDKWRVMRSATSGGSYSQVYLSGAGAGALDWSDTGEGNGTTWYYKLYARNVDGNDSGLGAYTGGTTWDVPGTSADPTLNPNAAGQIQVTKPSNPSDGGESIDFWYVEWDNNSGFPSPTGNSGDIAIGTPTYNATALGNGNNYYFRVRFKNAVDYGPYSAGTVNETTWDLPTVPQNFDVVSI